MDAREYAIWRSVINDLDCLEPDDPQGQQIILRLIAYLRKELHRQCEFLVSVNRMETIGDELILEWSE